MNEIAVFISHSTKYGDIAKSLKRSLQALDAEPALDIRLSEDMPGGTDWFRWIEENVRTSNIFVLLYPHASMDMGWCNYELGRFYDDTQSKKRPIICIMNTDIPKPPPVFQLNQAVTADKSGFTKFITELFVTGELTDCGPLNPKIGMITTEYYKRAEEVAEKLAQMFAEARVREVFYERRIIISVVYNDARQLDFDKSTFQGNAAGLNLLGLNESATTTWSEVRKVLGADAVWLTELEKALPTIPTGALPPALPPFRAATGIYIPVVTKAESVAGVLRQLIVIFVAASDDTLLPLLDRAFPKSMPDTLKFLMRLVRMIFHARWEILEPKYQEATYKGLPPERCAELVRLIVAEYDQIQHDFEEDGMSGIDKFHNIFHKSLRTDLKGCSEEWMNLFSQLREPSAGGPEELRALLGALLQNNLKWLVLAGKQFTLALDDFD